MINENGFAMIFGSDGVRMIEERVKRQLQDDPTKNNVLVNAKSLLALIEYYHKLTLICDHEWDYGSPIDAGLCRKCGKCGE